MRSQCAVVVTLWSVILAVWSVSSMEIFAEQRPDANECFPITSVHTFKVADGCEIKADVVRSMPPERIRETFFVDLSKVANRSLVDDVENDGRGGWCDQGPECDMRELQTGKRSFNGIPFEILPSPRALVALRTTRGSQGDMPATVDIAVGRKADALFFLHAAAWFGKTIGSEPWFEYIVHYADGKTLEVPMTRFNMEDWAAKPVADFPEEEGTFTTLAERVNVKMFGLCNIYRTQWSAPPDRRSVPIRSIEFVGNGCVVPVLLGITGVLEW